MMATSTNYSGRMTDLLIFQGTKPAGDQKIHLGFGDAGELTTGIQKLAQTFTTLFLLEKGSMPSHPEYGTDLLESVRTGIIQTEADVESIVSLAIEATRLILDNIAQSGDFPPDEVFQSAALLNFQLDKDKSKLTLYINVVSEAGTSRVVYLPIPVPL